MTTDYERGVRAAATWLRDECGDLCALASGRMLNAFFPPTSSGAGGIDIPMVEHPMPAYRYQTPSTPLPAHSFSAAPTPAEPRGCPTPGACSCSVTAVVIGADAADARDAVVKAALSWWNDGRSASWSEENTRSGSLEDACIAFLALSRPADGADK